MKTTKKIALVTTAVLILFLGSAGAQSTGNNYRFAFGLRAGETSGFTFNINTSPTKGIELIAGLWSNLVSLTALYEIRTEAFNTSGLKWYYGGGGHLALSTGTYYQEGRDYPGGDYFGIGLDGIIGLEYKIPEIPFAFNINLKPLIEINQVGDLYFAIDPGIGVKFTF